MNKRQTEYIALYLFVLGAILLFGVLARKFVLVKGYDEFSAVVAFFSTVVVLSALYISLQMTLNELLLPRMEKFLMRFPAFQKLEEVAVADTPREVSPVSVDSVLKSIDLMHFGWNIGKAFGKKRIHTTTFIKKVFAHALRDIEVSTIERKMSHTESKCRIKLDEEIG